MKNKRIAYCIPALYIPGGMERTLTMKANYLAAQGYDVHIIITEGANQLPYFPLSDAVKVEQLSINFDAMYKHSMVYRYLLYKRKMRQLKKRLNKCLCRIQPDITISMLRRDVNVINQMTDGSIKIGEIHLDREHYRAFRVDGWPFSIQKLITRLWMRPLISELRKLKKFVVLTYGDAANWAELDNVVVIPNPVSFFPDEHSECTAKKVIAVGRYAEEKGFDKLITAWHEVSREHPDWILHIYGDGWLREKLQNQVDELQLTHTCILEHTTSDIMDKYLDSSISVLSSSFEGFGLVIVEAMSCGVPVVSFACPCGPRDIISDNEDGFLVTPGDTSELANRIIQLIENEDKRIEMGRKAKVKAQKYRIEQIGRQWINLFNSL
ncbi:MAG: glycosyltransferase family 4 protein [Prevotellaceae bacterium]|jgi:glycosyltransferase involved in cell wall biosynthesis|nr:glycosyltransferase family 4 protein [Prevotellaceae bacterium]